MNDALQETRADIKSFRQALREFSSTFEPVAASPAGGTEAAITSLYLRIASLSSAGLMSSMDGEFYAARALTRCVAEHWMRLMCIVFDSVPFDFFGELMKAEAVEIDRRMRTCFPNGEIPTAVPTALRQMLAGALVYPSPSVADRKDARDVVQKYGFDQLSRRFLEKLKAGDGRDDDGTHGTMAFAYARFSACVHGGPLGHEYLTAGRSAMDIASTACDLVVPWATSLSMVLCKLRGPDHVNTRKALEIQGRFVRWTTGPRGPFSGART